MHGDIADDIVVFDIFDGVIGDGIDDDDIVDDMMMVLLMISDIGYDMVMLVLMWHGDDMVI